MAGKGDKFRPVDTKKYDKNYVKIFGESNAKDRCGNTTGLSSRQKNVLYSNAKKLREKIKDGLCKKDECKNPTDYNVRKMIGSEFTLKKDIETFKNSMKALGADPKEYNMERLRR